MRLATYWDLLSAYHLAAAVVWLIVLIAELVLIKTMKTKKKPIAFWVSISAFALTLIVGIIFKQMFYFGGVLADPLYDRDRFEISVTQDLLEKYKAECGSYPTTELGLAALPYDSETKCGVANSNKERFQQNYTSDGLNYVIEGTRNYSISGLIVRGSNTEKANLYIRENVPSK